MLPFTTIMLDKPRKLRMGMAASVEFEQVTGIKFQEINAKMCMEIKAKLLWIILKQEDSDITLAQTIQLVDDYAENLDAVMDAVNSALNIGWKIKNAPTPTAKNKNQNS